MRKTASFIGSEKDAAFLANAQKGLQLFGYPRVTPRQMVAWTADWISRGGATLGKPTHFEARDGKY
jgi:hypothetical protein